jgi:hypothetical protein
VRVQTLHRLSAALAVLSVAACTGAPPDPGRPDPAPAPANAAKAGSGPPAAETRVLFGDLHVHTSWSFDAFTFKTTTSPDDAYRFAQGAPLGHPNGRTYQLDRPLDFMAVTDHSEFLGVAPAMRDETSVIGRLPISKEMLSSDPDVAMQAYRKVSNALRAADWSVFGPGAGAARSTQEDSWARVVATANQHYRPGKFTTFIGYEWSSQDAGRNLHRNVIFGGAAAPLPFSSMDSRRPEDLWRYLDAARAGGFEVLAIPHNSNLSDGLMFADADSDGRPITAAYAAARARNEPIVEITQTKGTSETHPTLSAEDEFADFELVETYVGRPTPITRFQGGYVRDALKTGLKRQEEDGFNPFRFGLIGSSDTHVSMSPIDEADYFGKVGIFDGTPQARLDCTYCASMMDLRKFGASGLAAVWSRANTREAIFEALGRRETYSTTGPRMQVRVFAGYGLRDVQPGRPGWVEAGYRAGVPMGGSLPRSPGGPPTFAVWALKDPVGANLDRIQVVKVWSRNGVTGEKIYDVALSGGRRVNPATGKAPPVGNTVDPARASYSNTIGAATLAASWVDPDFDPRVNAAYYVRVLEIPTPRWSTYDAKTLGRRPLRELPVSIQERAFTSPIWYDAAG